MSPEGHDVLDAFKALGLLEQRKLIRAIYYEAEDYEWLRAFAYCSGIDLEDQHSLLIAAQAGKPPPDYEDEVPPVVRSLGLCGLV